jgi:hypothetical protein
MIDRKLFPDALSSSQEEVLNGTMLGDAHLNRTGSYQFKQCEAHYEYVKHISDVFQPFSNKIYRDRTKKPNNIDGKVINLDFWNGEYMYAYCLRTHASDMWRNYRSVWYNEVRKIVPPNLKLTPKTIAYWFMDDGSAKHKTRECLFSTQSFTPNEVDMLIDLMRQYNLRCTRQQRKSGPVLAVSAKSYWTFMDLISPFVVDCFKYKIDTSATKTTKAGWTPGKLDLAKAQEIRRLYATDKYTQEELAEQYGVTEATIWRVVNYKIYRTFANPAFGGTADVSLTLQVEACPSKTKTAPSSSCKDQIRS